MQLNKVNALWIFVLAFLISSEHVAAQDSSQSPVGTWQLVLQFPDGGQSQELLSLSRDGRALTTLFPLADTPGSSRWVSGSDGPGQSTLPATRFYLLIPILGSYARAVGSVCNPEVRPWLEIVRPN